MKYISLFAGIGGFDLALNKLGHTCVYVNEWDKYANDTYQKNFGHRPDARSITDVPIRDIPNHDLLVGGFPCQSFSIAGKRRGFTETRGTLFFEIARIARAKRTKYLLLENVKGLLSHDNGKTFSTIIRSLDELGYDVQWQVLNSKNFGVPQNRERVFIIGHFRGQPRPQVFPFGANAGVSNGAIKPDERRSQANYSHTLRGSNIKADQVFISEAPIVPTIRATEHKHGDNQTLIAIPVLTPDRINKRQEGRRFKTDGEPSFTLNTQDRHGVYDGTKIRRLTPIECERLQGFPDNWTAGVSDTQRYKQLGNAVTVNVIYEIAKKAFI